MLCFAVQDLRWVLSLPVIDWLGLKVNHDWLTFSFSLPCAAEFAFQDIYTKSEGEVAAVRLPLPAWMLKWRAGALASCSPAAKLPLVCKTCKVQTCSVLWSQVPGTAATVKWATECNPARSIRLIPGTWTWCDGWQPHLLITILLSLLTSFLGKQGYYKCQTLFLSPLPQREVH